MYMASSPLDGRAGRSTLHSRGRAHTDARAQMPGRAMNKRDGLTPISSDDRADSRGQRERGLGG